MTEAVDLPADVRSSADARDTFRGYTTLIVLVHALLIPHFWIDVAQIRSNPAFYAPAAVMIAFTTVLLGLLLRPRTMWSVALSRWLAAREGLFAAFSLTVLFLIGILSVGTALQTHLILDSALVLSAAYRRLYSNTAVVPRSRL